MSVLEWDKLEDRRFEIGVDRGVLYPPKGPAVPWNGLVSVSEANTREVSETHYDGMKIHDLVTVGSFTGTLSALTYPDEFTELEGLVEFNEGIFAADQPPQAFGLCYRTMIGNAAEGDTVGYKIHILYNVTAIPSDKTYATISSEPDVSTFEWNITAVPEEVAGLRPTAHIIINSLKTHPVLLFELEAMLYGTSEIDPELLSLPALVSFLKNWDVIDIIDHGDGTWSAIALDGYISMLDADTFQIENANAFFTDDDTYVITDGTDSTPSG